MKILSSREAQSMPKMTQVMTETESFPGPTVSKSVILFIILYLFQQVSMNVIATWIEGL